jgi:integrase
VTLEKAEAWAKRKVRELEGATGQQWVSPARLDRLVWLEGLCGGAEEVPRVLARLEAAKGLLGSLERVEEAARWFVSQGPASVERMTLRAAVAGYVTEYQAGHPKTSCTHLNELMGLAEVEGERELLEVDFQLLNGWIRRRHGGEEPSKRTVKNRRGRWATFLNRCRARGWWPAGRELPTSAIQLVKRDDRAPEIWTPEVAERVLRWAVKERPRDVSFLIVAGWLGCRPSECQRLERTAFDFEQGLLHCSVKVVGKTHRERWVPMSAEVQRWLKWCFALEGHGTQKRDRACTLNARAQLSTAAREAGVIETWPADAWRHSFITYRLQETGNIGQVADEAGNSPSEIRKSYRRPIPPGQWEKWWAVLEKVGEELFGERLG